MAEVNLVEDLLIAMQEGIKAKRQIKRYYDIYERKFDRDVEQLDEAFDQVISTIGRIFPDGLAST